MEISSTTNVPYDRVATHKNIINSLAPAKFEWKFRHVIFKHILLIDSWGISCEIALIWMSVDYLHRWSFNMGLCYVWLGVVRYQAITSANVDPDLCCHMSSLGQNVLNRWYGLTEKHKTKIYISWKFLYHDLVSAVIIQDQNKQACMWCVSTDRIEWPHE